MKNLDFEYSVASSLASSEECWGMFYKIIDPNVFTDSDIVKYLTAARHLGTAEISVLLPTDETLQRAVEKFASAKRYSNPTAIYRQVVRFSSIRRLSEAQRVLVDGLGRPSPLPALLASRMAEVAQSVMSAELVGTSIPLYGKDTLATMIEEIELEIKGKGRTLTTGFPGIDAKFGQIYSGDYVVVAANQSHGKTAFAVQMFAELMNKGKRGIYFTMEIKADILSRRMIAYLEQCQMFGFDKNTPKSTLLKIQSGMKQIQDFGERMIIHDEPAMTPMRIEEKIQQCLSIAPLDFIIIDHMHKMLPDGRSTGQYEKMTVISGALQAIGLKYNVPVIALAQLNRQPSNEDKFPKLSHLRDSGAIEADARKVFLLCRPCLYDLKDMSIPKDDALLIVAKNDKGVCGMMEFKYNGPTFTFTEVIEKQESQPLTANEVF